MLMWNGKRKINSVYLLLKPKTLTNKHYEWTIITRFLDLRTWPILKVVGSKTATLVAFSGERVKETLPKNMSLHNFLT